MADEQNSGAPESSTTAQTEDRYKGFKTNGVEPAAPSGQKEQKDKPEAKKPADEKQVDSKPSESSTEKPERKSGAQRRVDKLTAQKSVLEQKNKELEARIEELSKGKKSGLTKENFASPDEEFKHRLEQSRIDDELGNLKQQQAQLPKEIEAQAKREAWIESLRENFDDAGTVAYQQSLTRLEQSGLADKISQDALDYIEESDVGPKMLKLIADLPFGNEQQKGLFQQLIATRSGIRLGKLLDAIESYVSRGTAATPAIQSPQAAPKSAPAAPPVGSVTERGTPATGVQSTKDYFATRDKQRR